MFAASLDYESISSSFSFSGSSGMTQPFQLMIIADSLTELTEFFQVVILSNFVLQDGGGAMFALTDQERGRITTAIDRASVSIFDANSKL